MPDALGLRTGLAGDVLHNGYYTELRFKKQGGIINVRENEISRHVGNGEKWD